MTSFVVIIPVYNPDEKFKQLINSLFIQTVGINHVCVIDSGVDKTYKSLINEISLCSLMEISSIEFNHGGTRQWGMELYPEADIYIFMTQDAILADECSIANLVSLFDDDDIGAVYGRQLPLSDATLFARTAREINYGAESHVYTFADREKYGMKTCFMSNSFAAYRRTAMEDVGGFPTNTILSEDMYVAAKMLMKCWKIAYAADACVYHSHNYTIMQEFKRYFDIGVFHSRERWIRDTFGAAEGEGKKFVLYEMKKILQTSPLLLIPMIFRDLAKILGYRMGLSENIIPNYIKEKISMNRRYWKDNIKNNT